MSGPVIDHLDPFEEEIVAVAIASIEQERAEREAKQEERAGDARKARAAKDRLIAADARLASLGVYLNGSAL